MRNSHKIKECKKHSHKISCESWSSTVYVGFILGLWYSHCTVIMEITQNTDFFQNTYFKESNNMVVESSDKLL